MSHAHSASQRDHIESLALELQAQARVVAQLVLHKDWDRAYQQSLIYEQIQAELHEQLSGGPDAA